MWDTVGQSVIMLLGHGNCQSFTIKVHPRNCLKSESVLDHFLYTSEFVVNPLRSHKVQHPFPWKQFVTDLGACDISPLSDKVSQ